MRIGLALDQFDPRRGGAERSTVQFAAGLLERGHEVHVVAKRFGEQTRNLPLIAHRLENVRSRIGFAEAAQHKLRSLRLQVVHDMGAGWYCDVFQPRAGSTIAVSQRKLHRVPRWLRPIKRGFDRLTPRYRSLRMLMARQYVDDGRILIALSRMTADHFQQFHRVLPERIRLIYNGVDTREFAPEHRNRFRELVRRWLGVDDETVVLLIVAHNFFLKGVPTLIRAMSRLTARRRGVHLVVVGGKRFGRYVRWARQLGLATSITFTGSVEDAAPFYAAADIYVHPAIYDTCSRVVLEALASGLPVVTSRFNGAAELLTEGSEGFVISDPIDPDELVACLEPLFDPLRRGRMGRAARQLALNHTLARAIDETMAVYREVVGSSRRAG